MKTFLGNASEPRLQLPALSCCSDVPLFGSVVRFPFSDSIKIRPDDATKEQLYAAHMQSDFLHTFGLELTKSVVPVVIDHTGRVDATLGRGYPHLLVNFSQVT
jgi:hypothetical protein